MGIDRRSTLYVALIGSACAVMAAALAIAGAPESRNLRQSPGGFSDEPGRTGPSFVNWETAHVHPMNMTPDGTRLLTVNTADNRLAVWNIASGIPVLAFEVPVGLDPISVRARTNDEAWVVNNISDSISIVNLTTRNVIATLRTRDEPSDVVFAVGPGGAQRAFVTCSTPNLVMVFDPLNLAAQPAIIDIKGKDPRALAVSPDGSKVYAAIFNSGNASTILAGGGSAAIGFPPNVVSDPLGPYGGVNPPPNSGAVFNPPLRPGNPPPPRVGLIVKKNEAGQWMDDNNGNWTNLVSGPMANRSGRIPGWDLPDRDLAIINASTLDVQYATRLMTINMAMGINPASGLVTIVGTDAHNEIRFEPVVNGRFIRVNLAMVNPSTLAKSVVDLNPHLTYTSHTTTMADRLRSIGDPRGIVWNTSGTRGYITGMGSNNVIVVNQAGSRQITGGGTETITVGEGPTGLALDESRGRLYVLNRFSATISVISTASEQVIATVPFFDPTPTAIRTGRKHLYDTHRNSGLGMTSCASCHVDARMDFLAWDLGEPDGLVKNLGPSNLGAGIPGLSPPNANPAFQPWHPMKGPMTTQTLQDIIGHEPHHWRGDRFGIEEFNGAFPGLLGADAGLTPQHMQEFEDFLATIHFPPNPYRNFDNTMPATLPMPPSITTSGRFAPAGQPLPVGRPNIGLALYRDTNRRLDGGAFACVTCHTLPTGTGPDMLFSVAQFRFNPIPPGPLGERRHQLVSVDGSTNISIKTPQLRNMYQKMGFNLSQPENIVGFGYLHDGSIDTLARFVAEPVFNTASDQETADLTAFLLCFAGSDLPAGSINAPLEGPGTASKDAHAAVGHQVTLVSQATAPPALLQRISDMVTLAHNNRVGLIVKGRVNDEQRGFAYISTTGLFQSDRAAQALSPAELRALAAPGNELTYTVVPKGSEIRIGIDRDENGIYDGDEPTACYANCDASTTSPILNIDDFTCFINQFAAGSVLPHALQITHYANCDGSTTAPVLNIDDFTCFINAFALGCP